ncbi:class I SAM-dependent methyltransferase [Amycolatopsis albispora]|uniref:Methyltransferase type 12 n=1 Tax=Amycolatopsis albispora TaxID=1804986 RepID=A0A344L0L0_9PSEU|nr:class I SAM-dependent methyltransferase [Amycolatopsis albispora]AXB41584.1 methyltransferase type 12 [Amycolatopsis albispora]
MTHTHQHHHHGQAEILDLDAEVLAEHLAAIVSWLPLTSGPRQIVDLAAGTGAGTFALLERFPEAQVTAVDASPEHLERLREKACARGVEDQVGTVLADLDAPTWPDLGTPDLVWASAAMHHMADPDRALRTVRELLADGGLFAVVELAGLPRFLPENAPADRPGLEERAHAVADRAHAVPHRGADWGPLLSTAGFTVADKLTVAIEIEASRNEAIGHYALNVLRRLRGAVADGLAADDLAAFDRLLDTTGPQSLLHRADLALRTERRVWAARRD